MDRRLSKIAVLVPEGCVLADIGTDHAQLPVTLLKQGKIERAYACDVIRGPLESARKTIRQAGFEDRIEVIQSDGFDNVPKDATCAVISGMGFYTIREILERADRCGQLMTLSHLIVQSNTDLYEFRKWIAGQGWSLKEESYVFERGHDYVIMEIDTAVPAVYTEKELWCGPCLLRQKSEEILSCYRRRLEQCAYILSHRDDETVRNERDCLMEAIQEVC